MIIWGSTGKTSVIGQGSFFCPQCRNHADYVHRCVQRYFTLYFIPLFPTNTVGEYVQCQKCSGTFDIGILQLSAEQVQGLLSPWTCSSCQNVNPAAEMYCPRCQSARTHATGYSTVRADDEASARQVLNDMMPRPMPKRPEKKLQNPEHWQETKEPGRCQECGVMNQQHAARCRACGGAITAG